MSRRIAIALSLTIVAGVFGAAGSAKAMVWEIEGSKFTNGQSESVSMKMMAESSGSLESQVLGAKLKVGFTGLECVGCKIDQVGIGIGGKAHSTGKIKFTGLTVLEPVGCKTPATVESNALTDEIVTFIATYDKFFPAAGSTFLNLKIEGCPAAGTYPLKGSVTGFMGGMATLTVGQSIRFSSTDQANGGGSLTLGTQNAVLTSEATVEISGASKGKTWRVRES